MTEPRTHAVSSVWTQRSTNLSHLLTVNAARLGDRPALIRGDNVLDWKTLDARVSALAAAMRSRFAIVPGERVMVQMPNCFEMVEAMLAIWRLGAVWVPSNFRHLPAESAHVAAKADVSLLIAHADYAAHADASRAAASGLRHVLVVGGSADQYEPLLAGHAGQPVADADVLRDDPCWLFFTSGSTGRPKAAVLTHGQLTFTLLNHLHDLMPGTTCDDASLVVAPLSHGAGMHLLTQIAVGAASVLMPEGAFDPAAAWQLVEQHRIGNLFTVPTIVKMLTEHPSVDQHDHASLRHVIYAGAPMYREDQKHALSKLGPVLVQYYGLGEVTGAITVLPPVDHHVEDSPAARAGTCGYERTGMCISIRDPQGRELLPFETGEVWAAGPAVCAGYYRDDEANGKAFRDGWFCTGDVGHLDEQRYLYLTGRLSDMYISGGSNVYPREVEESLLEHPALSEVAVLGCSHPKWGQVGVAVCVRVAGQPAEAEDLDAHLSSRLARYKRPARYVFLEAMPKSSYGKITKRLVQAELEERGLWPDFGLAAPTGNAAS